MDFDKDLVRLYPYLRRYALSLCRNPTEADDLVQETMLKALANVHQFEMGTNLAAWTTTILTNAFRDVKNRERRRHNITVIMNGNDASIDAKEQFYAVAFKQAMEWLETLPIEQQQALGLISVGQRYDDAAEQMGTAVGTVKSRVHRARHAMRDHKPED